MLKRLRRYRSNPTVRTLFRDISLEPQDLIAPLFIHDGASSIDIPHMPFAQRLCLEDLLKTIERLLELGIKGIALFPVISEDLKEPGCRQAYHPEGLIPTTISTIKKRFPQLFVMADIALDPYHPQGQDGIMSNQGFIDNDLTLSILAEQALCYAHAGADALGASDMMDGRIRSIREHLEKRGLIHTLLISYAVKFASHLYGPFRHAVDSARFLGGADKKTYQMDPQSSFQIKLEAQLDEEEGADVLLVKPGLHYLDIIYRLSQESSLPIWSYHVSGECAQAYYASLAGAGDLDWMVMEALIAQKRAGAQKILTYFAEQIASGLQ